MPNLFILNTQIFINKTRFLPKSPLLKNKYCLIFSKNMSTNIKTNSLDNKDTDLDDLAFREWLAGIIDGDGYFLLSKNGYNSCEITMDARDKKVLYLIQQRYGGSVKQVSNAYAFKYKLRNRAGLIAIINDKCSLNIPESLLDTSDFYNNSWLTGFTESDGYFGIKYVEGKSKSVAGRLVMKRARSEHVTLKYRLDQRAYDRPTSLSMLPFMEKLAIFLNCHVKTYSSNKTKTEVLSLTVSAIGKLELLVNYFDKYPLIGDKHNDYKKWRIVYDMMIAKDHLSPEGRLKIKSLIA